MTDELDPTPTLSDNTLNMRSDSVKLESKATVHVDPVDVSREYSTYNITDPIPNIVTSPEGNVAGAISKSASVVNIPGAHMVGIDGHPPLVTTQGAVTVVDSISNEQLAVLVVVRQQLSPAILKGWQSPNPIGGSFALCDFVRELFSSDGISESHAGDSGGGSLPLGHGLGSAGRFKVTALKRPVFVPDDLGNLTSLSSFDGSDEDRSDALLFPSDERTSSGLGEVEGVPSSSCGAVVNCILLVAHLLLNYDEDNGEKGNSDCCNSDYYVGVHDKFDLVVKRLVESVG